VGLNEEKADISKGGMSGVLDSFYKYSAPDGALRDHSRTERESSDTLKSVKV